MNNNIEYILCAAIKRKEPRNVEPYWKGTNDICNIEIGYRHHDIIQRFGKDILSTKPEDQGFYTSKGFFVDRYKAMEIAFLAGQVSEQRALSKTWLDNNDITFYPKCKLQDTHIYNMLFSEDLY